jgi:hypothetical protein
LKQCGGVWLACSMTVTYEREGLFPVAQESLFPGSTA